MRFFFSTVITMFCSFINYFVSNTFCVVFLFFSLVLRTLCCQFLDCPFLIALSVFSKVYLLTKVVSFIPTRSDEKCIQYNLL